MEIWSAIPSSEYMPRLNEADKKAAVLETRLEMPPRWRCEQDWIAEWLGVGGIGLDARKVSKPSLG